MNSDTATSSPPFKICPGCGKVWQTREDLLRDPQVTIKGYQVNFDHLKMGLFLFDHEKCKTTAALKAAQFTDLYKGPIYEENMAGTDECPEYCLKESNLQPCPNSCECAYVREVLQIIQNWPKADIVAAVP